MYLYGLCLQLWAGVWFGLRLLLIYKIYMYIVTKNKKIKFSDGGYIEETPSGLIYVGVIANECGHIIRRANCSLDDFITIFNGQVQNKVDELLKR